MATVNRQLPNSSTEALWPTYASPPPSRKTGRSPKLPTSKSITIALDDSTIRVVAFDGRRVVDWTSIDLNGDGALELPAAFNRYSSRFSRKITDLPFYMPLIRFMAKPDVQRRYLSPVIEAGAVTTIPFEQSEVDIAWRDLDSSQTPEVMITATPKREIDAHIDLMTLIGIKPSAVYSKPVAMGMAAGIPNAVVTHLGAGSADLVLVRDDVPRMVHRVALPSSDDPEAYAAVLTQAVDELAGYEYERANDPHMLEVPWIVLTGAVPGAGPLDKALQAALGGRLRKPSPRVWYPDSFPAAEYAANLGLAVADWGAHPRRWHREDEALVAGIDLLPERHRYRLIPKAVLRTAIVSASAALLVSTAFLGAGYAQATTVNLQTQIAELEREARLNAVQASRFNSEQTAVIGVTQQLDALESLEASGREAVVGDIARLAVLTTESPVRRVSVVSIDQVKGILRVTASATSVDQALAFAEAMRSSGLFEQVEVKDVLAGAASSSGATLTVNIHATYRFGVPPEPAK